MYKISSFDFTRFKNAEHVIFFRNVQIAIEKAGASILGLNEDLVTTYGKTLDVEQDIVNRSTASVYTPEMEALDEKRDRLFRSIRLKLQAILYAEPDSELAQYINPINKYIIGKYLTEITQLPYQEESAVITGFILDVNKYLGTEGIESCGLGEDLFNLEAANKEFSEQYHDRVSEKAGIEDDYTKSLRVETENQYHMVALYVEFKANTSADTPAGEACIALIAHIEQLMADARQRLNARAGKSSATSSGSGSGSGSTSGSGNVSPIPFPNK